VKTDYKAIFHPPIFKQDKGKGTTPFPFISHHPATAGWDGNNGTFVGAKVWGFSSSDWGQFR
jgi:hypothetical protein